MVRASGVTGAPRIISAGEVSHAQSRAVCNILEEIKFPSLFCFVERVLESVCSPGRSSMCEWGWKARWKFFPLLLLFLHGSSQESALSSVRDGDSKRVLDYWV